MNFRSVSRHSGKSIKVRVQPGRARTHIEIMVINFYDFRYLTANSRLAFMKILDDERNERLVSFGFLLKFIIMVSFINLELSLPVPMMMPMMTMLMISKKKMWVVLMMILMMYLTRGLPPRALDWNETSLMMISNLKWFNCFGIYLRSYNNLCFRYYSN